MPTKIVIWDIPTRLFHWALVAAIGYSWFAIEIKEDLEQHILSGYCILTLVLFRIIWGFVGSHYARFRSFIYPVSETLSYAKSLPAKVAKKYPGHNPMGGLSVLAMLLFIMIQVSTGLFSTDDYYSGPLNALVSEAVAGTITELHHLNFDVVTGLLALHVGAIIFYRLYKKEKLVAAMFSGEKDTDAADQESVGSSKLILAAIVLTICAASVYMLANTSFETEQSTTDYDFY
ncbi:MAG: cytochrome b/b6 domain-containing protein [Halioglobus sp.]